MSWATPHIERLRRGETVSFRPVGGSMTPFIKSGELVTVAPLGRGLPLRHTDVHVGDAVLCRIGRTDFVHLVKEVLHEDGHRFLIGNAHGKINGWATEEHVFGKVVGVAP